MKRFLTIFAFVFLLTLCGCGPDSEEPEFTAKEPSASVPSTQPSIAEDPTLPSQTEPRPCAVCQDTKSVTCIDCDGAGLVRENGASIYCRTCKGVKTITCPACADVVSTPDDPEPSEPGPGTSNPNFSQCGNCLYGLVPCSECSGSGEITKPEYDPDLGHHYYVTETCTHCRGLGMTP